MVFISIDFAIRSSGFAILNEQEVYHFGTAKYEGKLDDTFESMQMHTTFWINTFNNKIIPYIPADQPYSILVESLPVVGHFMTTVNMAVAKTNLYHALRFIMRNNYSFTPFAILPVKVKDWKGTLLKKANADKLYTKMWIEKFYPQCPLSALTNIDTLDAVAIGVYGVKYVAPSLEGKDRIRENDQ